MAVFLKRIKKIDITKYTDIVIDLSGLSVGVSFPLVKYIYQWVNAAKRLVNVHLTFISNNELDTYISKYSTLTDYATNARGFAIS